MMHRTMKLKKHFSEYIPIIKRHTSVYHHSPV